MLSISMLLFCITKLKLISWNYVPDYNPSAQGKSTKLKQILFSTTTYNTKRLSIQTAQPT